MTHLARILSRRLLFAALVVPLAAAGAAERTTELQPEKILQGNSTVRQNDSAVAWSDDDRLLASSIGDGSATVWTVSDGQVVQVLSGNRFPKQSGLSGASLAFSHGGTILAAGDRDGSVGIWDLGSGRLVTALLGHTDPALGVSFSPDDARIASASGGSLDYSLRLWNARTGAALKTLELGSIGHHIAWAPNGSMVAVTAWDFVKLYSPDGAGIRSFQLGNRYEAAGMIAFSPDGRTLAGAGGIGGIQGRAVETGAVVFRSESGVDGLALRWCRDGHTLVSAGKDGRIVRWRIDGQQLERTAQFHLAGMPAPQRKPIVLELETAAISNDCTMVAGMTYAVIQFGPFAGMNDGRVAVWRLAASP